MELRATQACILLLNDQLIICDSVEAMKRIVDTDRGDEPAMIEDEQFSYITGKMTRMLGTDMPAALLFSRPAEQIKLWLDIAKSDNSFELMEEAAVDNPVVAGLMRTMEDNPLPDFEQIRQYFPPQGSFITDDETGYHILAFSIRSEDMPEESNQ